MSKPNDGGMAFPGRANDQGSAFVHDLCDPVTGQRYKVMECPGMSLRAWLAGMAMQGLCANRGTIMVHGAGQSECVNIADASVAYADALLAELEKEVT